MNSPRVASHGMKAFAKVFHATPQLLYTSLHSSLSEDKPRPITRLTTDGTYGTGLNDSTVCRQQHPSYPPAPPFTMPPYHCTKVSSCLSPSMACRSDLLRDMSTDKNKGGSVLVERESTGATADRPILRTFAEAAGCKQVCALHRRGYLWQMGR